LQYGSAMQTSQLSEFGTYYVLITFKSCLTQRLICWQVKGKNLKMERRWEEKK